MTDDQARELFGAALDGDLSGAERAAFDAHLEAHAELALEFERFQATFARVAALHQTTRVPDLLPGVQKKLRERGRGGLGDGTAQLRGRGFLTPLSLGFMLVGLVVILWLAMSLMNQLASQ